MKLAAFILCLLSTIAMGILIVPLLWCVPMTISVYKYYKGDKFLGVGFKVCTLLFVSLIGGVILLCDDTLY